MLVYFVPVLTLSCELIHSETKKTFLELINTPEYRTVMFSVNSVCVSAVTPSLVCGYIFGISESRLHMKVIGSRSQDQKACVCCGC